MKNLLIAWGLVLAVIGAAGAYLWFAEVPEAVAKPAQQEAEAIQEPGVLSSGPIPVEIDKATESDEDCLGSC